MADTLGVAVHGLGWVSTEHIRAYMKNPATQVTALCSRRPDAARRIACDMGLGDVRIVTDYADLITDPNVQAISLCSPPNQHPAETIAAANAGKHVLIEKAAANDLPSLRAMADAVGKSGVRTVVSFVLHWNPEFMWIRSMMDKQAIGKVFYAEVDYWHNIGPQYRQYEWNVKKEIAGSVLLSAGCHAIDALRYLTGDEVVEVAAYSNKLNPDYEYDTNLVGILQMASGAIAKVSASFDVQCPYAFNIDLLGDKGAIRDNRIYAKEFFAGQTGWMETPTIRPDSGDVTHHPFEGEINHFVDCVLTGKESHVNLADAVKTHEVCLALDHAAATGKHVRLADLDAIL
jgi:predicted dehydrogenase